MTIEIRDNTKPDPSFSDEPKVIACYIAGGVARFLGLFHILPRSEVQMNPNLPAMGRITEAVLCACMAPKIPYHIKPIWDCVYLKLPGLFITMKFRKFKLPV